MAALTVGATVNVYYESSGGSTGQATGTVVSLGPDYLEITTASGSDVSIGWARITSVIS